MLSPRRAEIGDAVADFLESVLRLHQYRNDALRQQLLTLCKSFNVAGIRPILLKGAPLLLADNTTGFARMMLDLDVWVPDASQQPLAIQCLHDLGYEMRGDAEWYRLHHQHHPPFFCDAELARIELHRDMVDPRYADIMNQTAVAAASIEHNSDGIQYRVLDDQAALALSYLQCRDSTGVEGGHVTMMKWFDFLDRAKRMELGILKTRADLGLSGDMDAVDHQLLTALNIWCALPYQGTLDRTFAGQWEHIFDQSFIVWFVTEILTPLFELRRWKGKTVNELRLTIGRRLSGLPSLLRFAA